MKLFDSSKCIKNNYNIGIRHDEDRLDCEIHKHSFIEIVYISDGECTQLVDGAEYRAKRGDIIFINCGATHSFDSKEGFSDIEIFFSPKILEDESITPKTAAAFLALSSFNEMRADKNGGMISFSGEERQEVEHILDAMLREYEKDERVSRTVMESYLNILMIRMMSAAQGGTEHLADDILKSLKDYIDTHPEEQMTLSTLAAKSYYNPSYLSRVFKKRFDSSPTEYIRQRRIVRAKELLLTTDSTVEEIINLIGFSDRSSFYHSFSKETGITPSEYRAAYKK